jgi:hypothetical protein
LTCVQTSWQCLCGLCSTHQHRESSKIIYIYIHTRCRRLSLGASGKGNRILVDLRIQFCLLKNSAEESAHSFEFQSAEKALNLAERSLRRVEVAGCRDKNRHKHCVVVVARCVRKERIRSALSHGGRRHSRRVEVNPCLSKGDDADDEAVHSSQ